MLSDNDLELLSAYIDGALNETDRAALESRLRADAELRRELSRLQAAVDLVRLLPPLAAPRDFRLTPRMVRRPTTIWTSAAFSFASAAAAILLLVVGVALFRLPSSASQPAALSNQVAALPTTAPTLTTKLGEDDTDTAVARDEFQAEEGEAATQVAQQPLESRELSIAAPTGTPQPTMASQLYAAGVPTESPADSGVLSDALSEPAADQARTEMQQAELAAPSAASGAAAESPGAIAPAPAPTQLPPTETPIPTTTPTLTPSRTPTPLPTATPTLTPTPVPPASIVSEPGTLGVGLIALAVILFIVAIATTFVRRRG